MSALQNKRLPLTMGLLLLLTGVIFYIYEPPFFSGLSRRVYDLFLKKNAQPVQTDAVAIIDIDDASLSQYGQWPWPRNRLADLTSNLWKNGAAVGVFDVIFIEPDRTSPAELSNRWKKEFGAEVAISGLSSNVWNFDALFATSLSEGDSVLGCFMSDQPYDVPPFYRGRFFEKGNPSRVWLPSTKSSLQPLSVLAKSATGVAFINTLPDSDNIVRRTPLVFADGNGRLFPALSLEAIRLYAQARKMGIIYDMAGAAGVQHIQLLNSLIPTDANGRLTLNYRSSHFPRYAAADLLENRLPEGALQDKIVFIGTSAAGLDDLVSTPLLSDFPGVEVHATAVDNILAGDILHEPRWMFFANLTAMLLGGIFFTLLITYASSLLSFLIMLLADITVIGSSIWFLRVKHLVVLPAETILAWGFVFAGVIAIKYWQEETGRKKVRDMFGTMVSPDVLRYLEQNPNSFSLSGTRVDATMFFSDIANFTTLSETLEPDRLADLLNQYLSPMTELIMERGGYVDKYEGDAIMAEWGVPFPNEDHAAQACRSALEQQEKLDQIRPKLNEEFGCELHVRMGINTGPVAAGNMGSKKRFQYTVMGDAVNLASRLEGANKNYGTRILIGENTRQAIGERFNVRFLDKLTVKGKTQPVNVYELISEKRATTKNKHEDSKDTKLRAL